MTSSTDKNNNTDAFSPIRTPSLPPALPPKPFFLEPTYIRTTGNAKKIYEYICSFLYKHSPIKFECNYYKYSIKCTMVLNHVGLKFQINIYDDCGDIIIENHNYISRGTMQFIRLHRQLLSALISEKLISSDYLPTQKILVPIPQRMIPLSLKSISPLIELCKSNKIDCQINGIQILSRLCADADLNGLELLRRCGIQEILSFIKKTSTHFEIIDNCTTALLRLARKRRKACVDLE